jgi:hypothetical protein
MRAHPVPLDRIEGALEQRAEDRGLDVPPLRARGLERELDLVAVERQCVHVGGGGSMGSDPFDRSFDRFDNSSPLRWAVQPATQRVPPSASSRREARDNP